MATPGPSHQVPLPVAGYRPDANSAEPGMASTSTASEKPARGYAWLPWLGYALLAIAGALTHRQVFALLALLCLLTAVMLPRLRSRRPGAWLVWFGLVLIGLLLSLRGLADVLLEAVPVLINALLAYGFGRTLRSAQPLVARFILAIEGPARLAQPGVARYARQLTWFWTVLLATQAIVLAVLLPCADRSGLLLRFGLSSPLSIPERWAAAWLHLGGYLLLAATFLLEYVYRRWHLRHLDHGSFGDSLRQLPRQWPGVLSGHDASAP
jgi:uncharacterized membrane protein